MRHLIHLCAVLSLFAFSVGRIWGGPPPREQGERFEKQVASLQAELRASEFGIGLTLLEHEEVREELGFSPRMRMRVAELRERLRRDIADAFAKRDEAVARGAATGGLERLLRQANEGKRAELQELLTDGQVERLRQLILQFHGVRALHEDHVASALGLSGEQRKQLAELQAEFERAVTPMITKLMSEQIDSEADAHRQLREQIRPLYVEYVPRYAKVLTEAQREQFQQMQGEPLAFPDRPPQLEE